MPQKSQCENDRVHASPPPLVQVAGAHGMASSLWAAWALKALLDEHVANAAGADAAAGVMAASWLPVPYDLPRYAGGRGWLYGGVVEFTLAYSIYDLAYMVALEPGLAFMLHHSAILSCFAPLFFNGGRGFSVALVGIVVAEVANPLLGVWTWSKEVLKAVDGPGGDRAALESSGSNRARAAGGTAEAAAAAGFGGALAGKLSTADAAWHRSTFEALSLPVTVAYCVTRGVAMPLSVLDVAAFLVYGGSPGNGDAPVLGWMLVHCVAGFLGSVAWIRMLVVGYRKFAAKGKLKAQ